MIKNEYRAHALSQRRPETDGQGHGIRLEAACAMRCLFFFIVVRAPTYLLLFYVCEKGVLTFLTTIDLHFLKRRKKMWTKNRTASVVTLNQRGCHWPSAASFIVFFFLHYIHLDKKNWDAFLLNKREEMARSLILPSSGPLEY